MQVSSKNVKNKSSRNRVCLVGKWFPHHVGVFCTLLDPPKSHMGQKSKLEEIIELLSNSICPTYPLYIPKGTAT